MTQFTAWDFKAGFYHRVRNIFPFRYILAKENENIRALLNGVKFKGKKVIDIGTGTGNALGLVPEEAKVFGLDRSLKMLRWARRDDRRRFIVGDALALPFKAGSFDLALAIGIFEYQKDGEGFLRELYRIINDQGLVIVTSSPHGILTTFRNLLGNRVYPVYISKFQNLTQESTMVIKGWKKSLLQHQWLLRKEIT